MSRQLLFLLLYSASSILQQCRKEFKTKQTRTFPNTCLCYRQEPSEDSRNFVPKLMCFIECFFKHRMKEEEGKEEQIYFVTLSRTFSGRKKATWKFCFLFDSCTKVIRRAWLVPWRLPISPLTLTAVAAATHWWENPYTCMSLSSKTLKINVFFLPRCSFVSSARSERCKQNQYTKVWK